LSRSLVLGIGWSALAHLGWVFLKVGFVFFGGGFLLVPLLHRELIQNLHWMSQKEFVDGVALSQLTPGPVAILATFCGFQRGGAVGALLATVCVFAPAFALMCFMTGVYGRVRDLAPVRSAMQVFPPAIVGLLLAAALDLGRPIVTGAVPVIVGVVSLIAMVRFNVNPALLILGGALVGLATGR
jgi:chromate transporter